MIKLFLKSVIIGIANIIPGVSGGTLAVILGIYDDITEKIGNFLLVDIKTKIEYFKYLFVVALGAIFGILLFSKIINFSIINFPKTTVIIFCLLMLPSIPYIIKGLDYKKKSNIFFFCLGAFLMLVFIILDLKFGKKSSTEYINIINLNSKYIFKLFLCGAIAAGAMIIPGISGSLFLLMVGEYYNIVNFISTFQLKPLFAVAFGVITGLIIFSKIINFLLKNYREKTLFFIDGIITLSIIQIWTGILL